MLWCFAPLLKDVDNCGTTFIIGHAKKNCWNCLYVILNCSFCIFKCKDVERHSEEDNDARNSQELNKNKRKQKTYK